MRKLTRILDEAAECGYALWIVRRIILIAISVLGAVGIIYLANQGNTQEVLAGALIGTALVMFILAFAHMRRTAETLLLLGIGAVGVITGLWLASGEPTLFTMLGVVCGVVTLSPLLLGAQRRDSGACRT